MIVNKNANWSDGDDENANVSENVSVNAIWSEKSVESGRWIGFWA